MKRVIALSLCLVLLTGAVAAREATLTRADLQTMPLAGSPFDCTLGNRDFAGFQGYYGAWWWGFESYAYRIDGVLETCECAQEFALRSVHMLLALDTDTDLLVQAALHEAVDQGGGCYAPGAEIYAGPVITIGDIPELAYYDISLPLSDGAACAPPSGTYFIVFRFLNDGAAEVGIPVDSSPQACTNYNDWGLGWTDLVSAGFVGDIYMWADIDCCWNSVDTEDQTWGSIKQLFR
jgi:hypothetical protein